MLRKILAALLLTGGLFAGHPAAASTPLEIFVSIPPQKWLCERLGGDRVTVQVLIDKGQEPHTFEPSPRQLAALSKAALYFTFDMEFERTIIAKLAQTAAALKIVDVGRAVPRIPMTEAEQEGEHGQDGTAGGSVQPHDDHAGVADPHFWLSPPNLITIAEAMSRAMIAADPVNRDAYEKDLSTLTEQLTHLHLEIERELEPYRGAAFFVFHPAFGYFAHTYGLKQRAVETGGKSPSPRQITRLVQQARAARVKVIFVQPQFDPKSALTIAAAIGGSVMPLDPLAEDVMANLKDMSRAVGAVLQAR